MTKASFLLKLLKTICDFGLLLRAWDLLALELKHFAHGKYAVAKAGREKSPDIAKNHMKCTETS